MRFTIFCLVGALVAIAISDCAKGATYSQWTTYFNGQINSSTLSPNAKKWVESVVVPPNAPFPDPGSVPSPTPTPIPQGTNPPVMPTAPPTYVTDCPNLRFSDSFNEGPNFELTLSQWGPITSPVKWITNKPDALDFGGYYQPYNDGFTYETTSGHLVLEMHNYYQAPGPIYSHGNGNWFTGAIASAAWKNQTGGGPTTGFTAKAPSYWETAVWIPPLTSCDVPNAAGLWPSISLYTDPQLPGQGMELDLLEAYSVGYNQPHFSWHIWNGSTQLSAGGVAPMMADISQGWHIYGIWIDNATIHYYMDGVQVFSVANPGGVGLEPFYIMLTNGYGGGWTVSLTPSQTYNMHVAYVACWTN